MTDTLSDIAIATMHRLAADNGGEWRTTVPALIDRIADACRDAGHPMSADDRAAFEILEGTYDGRVTVAHATASPHGHPVDFVILTSLEVTP